MTLSPTLEKMKAAHELLGEYTYELKPVERGYANRTLYINLDDNTFAEKPVTQQMKEIFTGGRGFALKLLWDAVTPETQWDDPGNELVIANGPICGITAYPGSGKSTVVTLSPLTHNVIDSNVGGYFAPFLKFSGFDALEIQGKAAEDVIIVIDGDTGRVTIEAAPLEDVDSHLIGGYLTDMYSDGDEKSKRNISVMSAGQAAEHIRFAVINSSWYDVRRKEVRYKQAGRGGAGRVFRDKKIKAIVVKFSNMKGDLNGVADMALIRKAGQRINKEITDFDDSQNQMRKVGTANLVEIMDHFNLLPVHNFRYGSHPDTHKIDSKVWMEKFTQGVPDGCWLGCTMSCSHGVDHFPVKTGPYAGSRVLVDGPEYENAAGLGANIGNFDAQKVLELNFYCDTYGVDTISFANCVAYAMECYEEGLLDSQDTDGIDLRFGNGDAVVQMVKKIAHREGLGDILAEGPLLAAKRIGQGAERFAVQVKNQAHPAHEPRFKRGLAISYAVSPTGADHQHALHDTGLIQADEDGLVQHGNLRRMGVLDPVPLESLGAEKARATLYQMISQVTNNCLVLCNFLPWAVEQKAELVRAATGWDVTWYELLKAGERALTLARVFNTREGLGPDDDRLPVRSYGPTTDGALVDAGIDPDELCNAVHTYYAMAGWDRRTGIPMPEKLQELGVGWAVKCLPE